MGTVQKLAEKVKERLQAAHPKLRQTVINKLALAVGAMLEVQTPKTIELAKVLPVPDRAAGHPRTRVAAAVEGIGWIA